MKFEILLSTYNGEKFLAEQLDSLLAQTYDNFHITIRDDGSIDRTLQILHRYKDKFPERISIIDDGNNLGYPDCFWYLLNNTPVADMYAFCDQDDVWDKRKLESCNEMCRDRGLNTPILYVHDYVVGDRFLHNQSKFHLSENGFCADYPFNLIYYNMMPGFSMILNEKLRERILMDSLFGKLIPHDKWIFWSGFFAGEIIADQRTLVIYRRHEETVTITGKNNWIMLKEWWKNDVMGDRMTYWKDLAAYFSSCYAKEMQQNGKNIMDEWLCLIGEKKGVIPYLKRLFYPCRLKPAFVGELVLRFCFMLNK